MTPIRVIFKKSYLIASLIRILNRSSLFQCCLPFNLLSREGHGFPHTAAEDKILMTGIQHRFLPEKSLNSFSWLKQIQKSVFDDLPSAK